MKTSWQPLRTLFHASMEGRVAVFIFTLLISTTLLASQASAQTSAAPQPQEVDAAALKSAPTRGRSSVRGRVLYEDSGQPLHRALVLVYQTTSSPKPHETTTDERGEFVVRDLPAGKYRVQVNDPEIVDPHLLFSRGGGESLPTFSVDGASSAEVQVRVRRGGSITGRVTRADGKPAAGAQIVLLIKKDGRAQQFHARGRVPTDEHGVYRVSGLQTGEYTVSATGVRTNPEPTADGEEGGERANDETLVATYYPSATNIRNATTVHVEAGGETSGINITLIERAAYKVSGTVRTRRGAPLSGDVASISMMEIDESGASHTTNQHRDIDEQGRWQFDGVPDGTYLIDVIPHGEPSRDSTGKKDDDPLEENHWFPFIYKRQEVKVAGGDLKDLLIEVSEGASISGTVEMENGQPLPANLNIVPEADFSARVSARIRSDGTFNLKAVPTGNVYLSISSTSVGEDDIRTRDGDYYVKSIYARGTDLLREPLNVQEGAKIKDVRLVLSSEVATVTGHVRFAKGGAPVCGSNVVLLPADPARHRVGRGLPFGFTNCAGAYSASGAPGDYVVVAFGGSDLPLTDEKMKALAANAPRVTLRSNERKTVDLTVPGGK